MWLKDSLRDAVDAKRIHHQLLPMQVLYETGFDQKIVEALKKIGHVMVEDNPLIGFTAITAISRSKGHIEAAFDRRRHGSIEIF